MAMDIAARFSENEELAGNLITTGHSLGGGLASAASVAAGIPADTFNAAGLLQSTLKDNNDQEIHPGSLARYDNASGFIDAYFLDWDILSFMQDWTPLQDAIGRRIPMDGPFDDEMGIYSTLLLVDIVAGAFSGGAAWSLIVTELGAAAVTMGLAHTTTYYHYGLMVLEDSFGNPIWDIHGYGLHED